MDSEMEIITSWDVARQVAEAIGPEVILGPSAGPANLNQAAAVIKSNLVVETPPRSSVIRLIFRHPNPEVVQRALRELIDRYLHMHLEIHRAVGIVGDFLTQETDQIRSRLMQTEDELRKARNKAGVISIEDAKKIQIQQMADLRQQIFASQAELAERTSVLQERLKRLPASAAPAAAGAEPEPTVPPARAEEYRNVIARLGLLRRMEQDLLTQFREENSRVQEIRGQIAAAEATRRKLEEDIPSLRRTAPASAATATAAAPAPLPDLAAEAARIVALESRISKLNSQLAELRNEAANLDLIEPSIVELQRKRELDEANYRYYSSSLEQARIDEALGAGRISNISQIQAPSPPSRDLGKAARMYALLGGSGIFIGLGWAFLIELYLDRTVKRPADVERILAPPLFLSIPRADSTAAHRNATRALPTPRGRILPGPVDDLPRAPAPPFALYHETLRDRLIGFFEARGVMHKPKLVAVTGIGAGAGVSTTAAGLACSLSEIGEGNVLLVDMTIGQESARHFVRGEAVCDLEQVLSARDPAQVEDKLFVVAEGTPRDQLARNLPQRFSKLAPKLKASTFDYIIFDLPPVSPISITPRIAGFMDVVLLVVEAEKTEQDVFLRATTLLAETNVPLGVVLNKTRSYVPARLKQAFIGES